MLEHILPMVPTHKVYVEPFVGGGSLFWAKEPSQVEVLNDLNGNISAFYRACKNDFEPLAQLVENTLHCERTYKTARSIYLDKSDRSDVERAWAVWVGGCMSFGGNLFTHFQITHNAADRSNPGRATSNRRKEFREYANRLDEVMILEKDALKVLGKYSGEDVFAYCDPPYPGANQGHYKGYTQADFESLLETLAAHKGKFLLSSYPNPALDEFARRYGWHYREFDQRMGVKNGCRKTEMLTWNYQLAKKPVARQAAFEFEI